MVLVKQTHRMEDVVEAAAGGEAVVGVNPLQASDGQEHSNRRAEGKEGPGVEAELWVINRYLQEREKKKKNNRFIYNTKGVGLGLVSSVISEYYSSGSLSKSFV